MRFFILFFMVCVTTLNAQKTKTFEDKFGVQGEIRYQEEFVENKLPKHGIVDIRWRDIDDLGIVTYRIKGQTKDYLPIGKWTWEQAHWDYSIKVGSDIRPEFSSKGIRKKWEGSFVNGKPHGRWTFVSDSISSNSKTSKTLLKIDKGFHNGIPTGLIGYENNLNAGKLTLKGNLDKNGIASGTWIYQYQKDGKSIREEHIYQEGLLTEVRFVEGQKITSEKLTHNLEFLNNLNTNGKRIGEIIFEKDEFSSMASEDLFNGLNNHFGNGWKLAVFPYEVNFDLPKFKRLEYPLSTAEKNDIQQSKQFIEKHQKRISELLTDNIYIHRSRNVELDTTVAYLQLNLTRIHHIDSLLHQTQNPLFLYENRLNETKKRWINQLNNLRFQQGETNALIKVSLDEIKISETTSVFKILKNELIRFENDFPKYAQIIENTKTSLKREGELKKLEDQLVEQFIQLQSFYAEVQGIGKEINEKWLKGEVQNELQRYAQTENYEEALELGQQLTQQLNNLSTWKDKIEAFNTMEVSLKSHYTYMAYNPYNGANDIEIIRKRRFLNNILEHLFPLMRKELSEEENFEKWAELWNRQFEVYDFLVAFVSREDAQANRLEKRIRSERKAERILKNILAQMERSEAI